MSHFAHPLSIVYTFEILYLFLILEQLFVEPFLQIDLYVTLDAMNAFLFCNYFAERLIFHETILCLEL